MASSSRTARQSPRLPLRYEPGELLGEGGMGQVWAARDLVLDLPVAVKVLKPQVADRSSFPLRFQREVALQARLRHPNLVPLHDAGRLSDGSPFVAMALADGGSLARHLPDGLPWPRLLPLADELLAALSALHARGVIHLDLKPENVLLHTGLDQQAHVWLADLGIARLLVDPEQSRPAAAGTPAYMAPEQRQGLVAELDRRTDLYAVGMLLAQLAAAHPVPAGLADLLLSTCHPQRLHRPALAADLRLALDRLGPPLAPLPALPLDIPSPAATTWITDLKAPDELGELGVCAPPPAYRSWPQTLPPPPPTEPPRESTGEGIPRTSLELYALRETPIVGRGAERGRIWELARQVRLSGQPGVALVIGETGAGKTRLMESISCALEEGGWAETLLVDHRQGHGELAGGLEGAARRLLRPWGESERQTRARLERWFQQVLPGVPARGLAQLTARSCHLGPSSPDAASTSSWSGQLVQWVLHARCRRGMACVVVEDAHLASETGAGLDYALGLLNRASLGQPAPLLVLCALRSEALAGSLELRRKVEMLLSRGAQRIDLARLDRQQLRSLLACSLDLAPELREVVVARCEGNPLLARMLITSWAERGELVEVADLVYALQPGADIEQAIPEHARQLFLERAHQAARSSRDPESFMLALTLLSLAGRDLPAELLDILAGSSGAALLASGLVHLEEGRCRLDHQLLHEVMREAAARRADLRALHRQVALAWSRYGTDQARDVSVPRAEALLAAGEAQQAFPILAAAAVRALQQGRPARAIQLGEAGLLALERAGLPDDHPGAPAMLAATARALAELPDLRRAETLAQRSFEAASARSERLVAGATLGAAIATRGDWTRARQLLEALLDEPPTRDSAAARLLLLETTADTARRFYHLDRALVAYQQAIAAAESNEPTPRARLQRGLARCLRLLGRLDEASQSADLALELARRCDDPLELALCRAELGLALAEAGQRQRAAVLLEQARAPHSGARADGLSQQVQQAQAEILRHLGDHDGARKLASTVAQWGETRRIPMEAVRALTTLMVVELQSGRDQAAELAAERAAAASRLQTPVPGLDLLITAGQALAAARRGLWGPALDRIDRLRNRREPPREHDAAWLFTQLALAAGRGGQLDQARWLAQAAWAAWLQLGRPDEQLRLAELVGPG